MGSGTLYFDATQYGAQYAVDYSYDSDTFYIDSVQVKLAQYVSVWWGFNLNVKINDTTISSGSANHFIDTFDWYDLGISGSADITDEVEVTLTGSAIHNNYQFNVASPTTQTVTTGSGGDSGDDSGSSSDEYWIFIYQGDGTDLEVIRTWNETTGESNWDDEIPSGTTIVQKDYFSVYASALEGYENIKVDFNNFLIEEELEDNGEIGYRGKMLSLGNIEVRSYASLKEYKLSATAGTGSYITVTRKSSKKSGASLGVLSNGATIYHFDTLEVSVGVEAGYDIVDTIVTGCTENDDGTFTVTGDVTVTVTTKLTGLVYIDNGTTFVPCLIFIDNGVNWVQCIPYIDNGTSWVLCS